MGSLLAIVAQLAPVGEPSLKLMAGIASPVIAIAKTRQPIWRELRDKACAPAGVVYEANRASGRPGHGRWIWAAPTG